MKITKDNLKSEFENYKQYLKDDEMRSKVQETFDLVEFYGEDDDITKAVDAICDMVNSYIDQNAKPKEEPKKEAPKKKEPKPEKKPGQKAKTPSKTAKKPTKEGKKTKQAPKKKEFEGEYVDNMPEEIKVIARFVRMHEKTKSELGDKPRKLLAALQKAIRTKQIRKTSAYANEIMAVQKSLIKIVDELKKTDKVGISNYEKYTSICKKYRVSPVATFAKRFIVIQEQDGRKDDAKALLAKIEKSGENGAEIDAMTRALNRYINGDTDRLTASEQTLRGLYGALGGVDDEIMNSLSIEQKHFDTLPFTGEWLWFLGRPEAHFKMMIYGKAGSGKSTFALRLAGYLSKELGNRVLYVAKEEGFGYTLQEKISRLGVANTRLFFAEELPADLSNFDVVFFDSINTLELSAADLRLLPSDKAYVFVFQSRKDGLYMGQQAFAHDADTVIRVESMTAYKDKNRFGGENATLKVW